MISINFRQCYLSQSIFYIVYYLDSTTQRNDFRRYRNPEKAKPLLERDRAEKSGKPSREQIHLDPETFAPLRKVLPFDLMIELNDVTRGDPHRKFEIKALPNDELKEEIIRTRPRIYKSPAVSMDDVPDAEMRELLCRYMYHTDAKNKEREAVSLLKIYKKMVPDGFKEQRYLMMCRPDIDPEIDIKWNLKGRDWTHNQLVADIDRDAIFWGTKEVKCGACVQPLMTLVPKEDKEMISSLIKSNTIRTAHDKIVGYVGYKPALALGIPLAKRDLPISHPLLSASEALATRKKE